MYSQKRKRSLMMEPDCANPSSYTWDINPDAHNEKEYRAYYHKIEHKR